MGILTTRTMPDSLTDTVAAVRHASRILRQLESAAPLTVRAAAEVAGCSPSAAHRILVTLHTHGFALKDAGRHYRSNPGTWDAAMAPKLQHGSSVLVSVQRALTLLSHLAQSSSISVKESSALLQVAPSTAFRILKSLSVEGLTFQLADKRYRLSPLMHPHRSPLTLREVREAVEPLAADVRAETGETVHVWAPTGPYVRLLYGIEGLLPDAVPHDRWPQVPAYATAGGRTLLSNLPNPQVELIHTQGLLPWRLSAITTLESLKRRLAIIRRRGYDTNMEEGAQGVSGMALASRDPYQRPLVALGLALPSSRFSAAKIPPYQRVLENAQNAIETKFR